MSGEKVRIKETLRSFIAIELSEDIKKALSLVQKEITKTGADIRWVRPDNIHLTLKFLGDIEEEMTEKIIDALKRAGSQHHPFGLEISGAGIFPNMRAPRVIWAGVSDNENLSALYIDIERCLVNLGFEPDSRRFRPHLTLGRIRSSGGREMLRRWLDEEGGKEYGSMDVRSVDLMKSEPGTGGAKYKRLAGISFNRN